MVAARQSEVFQLLRANYNDAIAVEMEGFGFLSAAFAYPEIKAIVIRGISDLIEGKNDDSVEPEEIRQEKASHHASAFAFEILAKYKIDNAGTTERIQGVKTYGISPDELLAEIGQQFEAAVSNESSRLTDERYKRIDKETRQKLTDIQAKLFYLLKHQRNLY